MRKSLALALACMLVFGLMNFAQAEANDYELSAALTEEGLEVSLTNNTQEPITVTGVEMAARVELESQDPLSWGRNVLDESDELLGGEEELVIEPGATELIALIAPGLPDTWRPNNAADHTLALKTWVRIDDIFHNLGEVKIDLEPEPLGLELVLGSNSPTQHIDVEDVVLTLTNNTGASITISGPVVVQGIDHWSLEEGRERVRLGLTAGDTMTIPAGETENIAVLEPGRDISWRNFWSPQLQNLHAWINVDGEGLWWDEITHVIAGETSDTGLTGGAKFTADNLDGTATLTVNVEEATFSSGVVWNESAGNWEEAHSMVIIGPVTGMSKEDFAILKPIKDGVEFGEVLSVRETSTPGTYELVIGGFKDGEHDIYVELRADGEFMGVAQATDEEEGPVFTVEISSTKPIPSTLNPESGKYEAKLEFPVANISFSSDSQLTAELSLRRKGSSLNPAPAGAEPAGIFMDINVVAGDLGDSEITLEVKYSLDDIPVGMNENNLRLFRFNEDKGEWEELPDQEVDTDAKVIRVHLQGFSEFGVFEVEQISEEVPPTEELPATGAPVQTLFYLGMLLLLGGIALTARKQFA
ncbi:MAG: hypothetical protein FH749_13790 [Firmicutes bacterium]|nr:hypothetical protein [Bacillota bacterium]